MAAVEESSPSEEEMSTGCVTIHEIYDSEDAQEEFEAKLETALESGCQTIIIEPTKLGEETARWIQVGNCLHKTSVVSGLGALLSPVVFPESVKTPVSLSFGGVSIFCALMYGVSWQFDPCCKYQIEYNTKKLASLPAGTTSSPVVLVRTDDKFRKVLHNLVAGSAAAYFVWKFYIWYSE